MSDTDSDDTSSVDNSDEAGSRASWVEGDLPPSFAVDGDADPFLVNPSLPPPPGPPPATGTMSMSTPVPHFSSAMGEGLIAPEFGEDESSSDSDSSASFHDEYDTDRAIDLSGAAPAGRRLSFKNQMFDEEEFWRTWNKKHKRYKCLFLPQFGVGLTLYLNSLLVMALLTSVLAVFGTWLAAEYASRCADLDYISERDNTTTYLHEQAGQRLFRCPTFAYDFESPTRQMEWVVLTMGILIFLVLVCVFPFIQNRAAWVVARRKRDVSDYSVVLRNLNWRTTVDDIFYLLTRKYRYRVAKIVMIPSSRYLWKRAIKREKIHLAREGPCLCLKPHLWWWRIRRITKRINHAEDQDGTWERTRKAYVTFSHIQDSIRCMKRLHVAIWKQPFAFRPLYYLPALFGHRRLRGRLVRVEPAPHPDDIITSNAYYPAWKRFQRRIVVLCVVVFVLVNATGFSTMFNILASGFSAADEAFTRNMGIIVGFFIALNEILVRGFVKRLASFERLKRRSSQELRLLSVLCFVRVMFFFLAYFPAPGLYGFFFFTQMFGSVANNSGTKYMGKDIQWFADVNLSYSAAVVFTVFTAPPVMPLLLYPYHVIRHRGIFAGLHRCKFNLAQGYVMSLSKLFIILIFGVFFPITFFLIAIQFWAHLFVERINIMLFYEKPLAAPNSFVVDERARFIAKVFFVGYCFFAGYCYMMRRVNFRHFVTHDVPVLGPTFALFLLSFVVCCVGCCRIPGWRCFHLLVRRPWRERQRVFRRVIRQGKKEAEKGRKRKTLYNEKEMGSFEQPFEDPLRLTCEVRLISRKRRRKVMALMTKKEEFDALGDKLSKAEVKLEEAERARESGERVAISRRGSFSNIRTMKGGPLLRRESTSSVKSSSRREALTLMDLGRADSVSPEALESLGLKKTEAEDNDGEKRGKGEGESDADEDEKGSAEEEKDVKDAAEGPVGDEANSDVGSFYSDEEVESVMTTDTTDTGVSSATFDPTQFGPLELGSAVRIKRGNGVWECRVTELRVHSDTIAALRRVRLYRGKRRKPKKKRRKASDGSSNDSDGDELIDAAEKGKAVELRQVGEEAGSEDEEDDAEEERGLGGAVEEDERAEDAMDSEDELDALLAAPDPVRERSSVVESPLGAQFVPFASPPPPLFPAVATSQEMAAVAEEPGEGDHFHEMEEEQQQEEAEEEQQQDEEVEEEQQEEKVEEEQQQEEEREEEHEEEEVEDEEQGEGDQSGSENSQ